MLHFKALTHYCSPDGSKKLNLSSLLESQARRSNWQGRTVPTLTGAAAGGLVPKRRRPSAVFNPAGWAGRRGVCVWWAMVPLVTLGLARPVAAGITAYYQLDGNVNAAVGPGGSLVGANSTWGPGQIGGCLVLDGNGNARVADDPALDPLTYSVTRGFTGYTVCFWASLNSTNETAAGRYLQKGFDNQKTYAFYWLSAANSVAFVRNSQNGTSYAVAPNLSFAANTWHQVAGSFDGNVMALYVDGQLVGTAASVGGIYDSTGDLAIGARNSSGTTYTSRLNAKMDDVGVWDEVLDARKVAVIYALGSFQRLGQTDSNIDLMIGAFNAGPGHSLRVLGRTWSYASGLGSANIGTTGGSVTNNDAFVVLDNAGNGMKLGGLPIVEFATASASGSETNSPAVLNVVMSFAAATPVSVQFAATGGTATGGVDYNLAPGILSFSPGQTNQTISIPILNDGREENDETIQVSLLGIVPQPNPPALNIVRANNGLLVSWPALFTNLHLQYRPDLIHPPPWVAVTDPVTETNNLRQVFLPASASGGFYRLIGPSGADLQENAWLGNLTNEVYTIVDPQPAVQFASSAGSGLETVSPATVAVTLSAPSAETVTVGYAVTGGTATGGGVDYELSVNPLSFAPGETNKVISLNVVADGVAELDETVVISLTNALGAKLGNVANYTYTILDADRAVSFQTGGSSGLESATPARIPVVLSTPSTRTVSVAYATTGGTATGGGADYLLPGGTLTFSPGVTTQHIDLSIVDDTTNEPDETVVLTLSNPINANLGSISNHTYTIIDNDGSAQILFTAMPVASQLYPRNRQTGQANVLVAGTVLQAGWDSVLLQIEREDASYTNLSQTLVYNNGQANFSLSAPILAELANYRIRVYLQQQTSNTLAAAAEQVVAGDAFLVNGQSNAEAFEHNGSADANQNSFLRSFGTRSNIGSTVSNDVSWHLAEGDAYHGPGAVGQWALRLGRLLVESNRIPVAIINEAEGGMPISYFQRNDSKHDDLSNNYGCLLYRANRAGLTGAVRAILWYQGESEYDNGPVQQAGFETLYADWMQDYPNVEKTYVHQVRVGCGVTKWSVDLRERQRLYADEHTNVVVVSTTAVDPHDGCHFAYAGGYEVLGDHMYNLVERDLYGVVQTNIEPPNIAYAYFSKPTHDEITLVMRNTADTLVWQPGAEADFEVDTSTTAVISGRASGNTIILKLSPSATNGTTVTYAGHSGPGAWVKNLGGVGLLCFNSNAVLTLAPQPVGTAMPASANQFVKVPADDNSAVRDDLSLASSQSSLGRHLPKDAGRPREWR